MNRHVTRTFLLFLLGFIAILAVAFGVIAFVGPQVGQAPQPVDNTASKD